MRLKQMLDGLAWADLEPFVRAAIEANADDRRPFEEKEREVREGFEQIAGAKPTFGYIDSAVDVKLVGGRLNISNTHLGTPADLLSHQVKIAPDVTASREAIVAGIVYDLFGHKAVWERYRDVDDFEDLM